MILKPGETANIAVTPISISSDGAIIGSGASSVVGFREFGPAVTPFITLADEEFSLDPPNPGAIVCEGPQTLTSGLSVVVYGTTVSLGSVEIILGGSTIPVPIAGSTASIPNTAVITLG